MQKLEQLASAVCLLFLAFAPAQVLAEAPTAAPLDSASLAGRWHGAISLPNDQSLTIAVELTETEGGWTGTIDIPQQGAEGVMLESIAVAEAEVGFTIAGIPGAPRFEGSIERATPGDGRIVGRFSQGGMEMPFHLEQGGEPGQENVASEPGRPQDPIPPYPYDAREVRYPNGELTLAGTVTVPHGDGPFPAALLISGSGTQDRDESLLGHRPFLVLADHLTRAGIAVLRVDDRGAGGSTGDPSTATSADYADDVEVSLAFLRDQPKIDPARVGLIGHSEGGLIAPMVASRNEGVAFVVLMAGTGVPGIEVIRLQMRRILEVSDVSEEHLETLCALQRRTLEAAVSDLADAEFRALVSDAVDTQIAIMPEGERPSPEVAANLKETSATQARSPWFRYFLGYDPRPALRAATVPVLAINGELDLQVDADQNLSAIEQALAAGGNEDVSIVRLPRLNHLFQTAETGSPDAYGEIEETIAPLALDTISSWILERFTVVR